MIGNNWRYVKYNHFCKDFTKIENYEKAVADETNLWVIHHRLETHRWSKKQQKWIRRDEDVPTSVLKSLGLYYKRPPEELIFMTKTDHCSLHWKGKKRGPHSDEHKQKLRAYWEHLKLNKNGGNE